MSMRALVLVGAAALLSAAFASSAETQAGSSDDASLAADAAAATRCGSWRLVNPQPQANHLYDVANGGGRWIAVGDDVAVTSFDGERWNAQALANRKLRGIAYGDGVFVAVGDNGAIVRWMGYWDDRSSTRLTDDLGGVAWSDGLFVAVGPAGRALVSRDAGRTWSAEPAPAGLAGIRPMTAFGDVPSSPDPPMLAWKDDAVVIRGGDGTWRELAPQPGRTSHIRFAYQDGTAIRATGTYFWLLRGVEYLVDGVWTLDAAGFRFQHMGSSTRDEARLGDVRITLLPGTSDYHSWPTTISHRVQARRDGSSTYSIEGLPASLTALAASDRLAVIVGWFGTIWTSTDGRSWAAASGPAVSFDRIEWNGRAFAASGTFPWVGSYPPYQPNRTLAVSGDGAEWSPPGPYGWSAGWGWDLGLARPALGRLVRLHGWVGTSLDGRKWQPGGGWNNNVLIGSGWAGDRYVMVTEFDQYCPLATCPAPPPHFPRTAATSRDLVDWRAMPYDDFAPELLHDIVDNGRWRVGAVESELTPRNHASVLRARSGARLSAGSWERVDIPVPAGGGFGAQEARAAVGGLRVVIVGGNTALSSRTGDHWRATVVGDMELTDVTWTGSEFLAVGTSGYSPRDSFTATSRDGVLWSVVRVPSPGPLRAVAASPRVQLLGGGGGVILRRTCTAPPPPTPTPTPQPTPDEPRRTVRRRAVR